MRLDSTKFGPPKKKLHKRQSNDKGTHARPTAAQQKAGRAMTNWWLGYAKAGKEFEVQAALSEMGIRCEVPRKVEAKRVPTKRTPVAVTTPYMGNYVFINCDHEDWHRAHGTKHLASTMQPISDKFAARHLLTFIDAIELDYSTRMDAINAGERVSEYQPGERIEILAGPLKGQFATFTRIIERADELFPRIEAEGHLFGRAVKVDVDPIHARKATA